MSSLSCHNLSAVEIMPTFGCRHSGKLLCVTVSSVPLIKLQAVVKVYVLLRLKYCTFFFCNSSQTAYKQSPTTGTWFT